MGRSGACLLARRCPDTPRSALTASAGQPQAAGNRGLVAAQCGFCGYFGFLWPGSELRKFSGESYSGRYPTSGSRSFVAKYFLVGVRIRNEYQNVAARRRFLLRVFKTRPGVGIAFRDTPATASAPPDPAHDRRSALRINRRTPPKATSTGPSSPGAVALGP